jgi:hypothetical protein
LQSRGPGVVVGSSLKEEGGVEEGLRGRIETKGDYLGKAFGVAMMNFL